MTLLPGGEVRCQAGDVAGGQEHGGEVIENIHSTDVESMINRDWDTREGEGECTYNGLGVSWPPRTESVRPYEHSSCG